MIKFTFITRWRIFGAWLALAIAGQYAALRMIDAGPLIRYQHLKPISSLISSSPELVTIFAIQSILVVVGVMRQFNRLRRSISAIFRPWQLLAIGFVIFMTSATVSREVGNYLAELPAAAFIQFVNLFNVLLAIRSLPDSSAVRLKERISKLLAAGDAREIGIDRFAVMGAIWMTVIAGLLSYFVYQRHPHIPDEVVYLLHARYLAESRLSLPVPPVEDAFFIYLMTAEPDRWYSPFPPGWPLMLAAGFVLGAPWLINPILAGIHVVLAYLLIGELYDRRTARLAVLLLCVSPWHVFMSMNFMAHTFASVCTLAAALAVFRAGRGNRLLMALLGGAATAMVGMIRPLEGLILTALFGCRLMPMIWKRRLGISTLLAFFPGGLLIGGAGLLYNRHLTGSPTYFPVMAFFDKYHGPGSNAMGFGPERGAGWAMDPNPGHDVIDALINTNLNAFSINIELFGWSAGSLLLLAVFFFCSRPNKIDFQMIAVMIATFTAHFFYWYSGGPDFGARYWYLMLIPCVVLSIRGMNHIERALGRPGNDSSPGTFQPLLMVLIFSLIALINYFPWRMTDKYHHYLRMRPDIRVLAEKHGFGRSLVLIRGDHHPDYASAATYNPLDLNAGQTIYAWDKNPDTRRKVLSYYRDRPVWIIDGPSITGAGFAVREGPIEAESLLDRRSEAGGSK